ncbi:hypothetical protein ES705_40998 [subsurface metagenome]
MEERKFIFTLMPSKEEFDIIYEDHIKKPLVNAGYLIKRDKEILGSSKIVDDILHHIRAAEIIIADLTSKNVNVFYELGIADEKKKYLILIAQKGENLPFDLSQRRTIFYKTDEFGLDKLTQEILFYVKAYKRVKYIDKMISNFGNSSSFFEAIDYWKSLMEFEPELNTNQINNIAKASAQNDQIFNSYKVSNSLNDFFKRHEEIISKETIKNLMVVGFLK